MESVASTWGREEWKKLIARKGLVVVNTYRGKAMRADLVNQGQSWIVGSV